MRKSEVDDGYLEDAHAEQDAKQTSASVLEKFASKIVAAAEASQTQNLAILVGRSCSVFSFCFGILVLLVWAVEPPVFHIHFSDWMFWVVFLMHALVVLLTFISRVNLRSFLAPKTKDVRNGSFLFRVAVGILTRSESKTCCDTIFITVCLLIHAIVTILSLFVTMQAVLSESTYLHNLKIVYSLAFAAQSFAIWASTLGDLCALDQSEYKRGYGKAVVSQISSFASTLSYIPIPILGITYLVYCNVCCSGIWSSWR